MSHVNFSVMSRSELVTLLEKTQAILSLVADEIAGLVFAEDLAKRSPAMSHVNFSVMSRSELVTLLEKTQAILSLVADETAGLVLAEDLAKDGIGAAFDRGYLNGLCHALNVLQQRKTKSNQDERLGKEKAPHRNRL